MNSMTKDELIAFANKHLGRRCVGQDKFSGEKFSGRIIGYGKIFGSLILENVNGRRIADDGRIVVLDPSYAGSGWYVRFNVELTDQPIKLDNKLRKLAKQLAEDIMRWEP